MTRPADDNVDFVVGGGDAGAPDEEELAQPVPPDPRTRRGLAVGAVVLVGAALIARAVSSHHPAGSAATSSSPRPGSPSSSPASSRFQPPPDVVGSAQVVVPEGNRPTFGGRLVLTPIDCPRFATCSASAQLPGAVLAALRAEFPGAAVTSSSSALANRSGRFEPDLLERTVAARAGRSTIRLGIGKPRGGESSSHGQHLDGNTRVDYRRPGRQRVRRDGRGPAAPGRGGGTAHPVDPADRRPPAGGLAVKRTPPAAGGGIEWDEEPAGAQADDDAAPAPARPPLTRGRRRAVGGLAAAAALAAVIVYARSAHQGDPAAAPPSPHRTVATVIAPVPVPSGFVVHLGDRNGTLRNDVEVVLPQLSNPPTCGGVRDGLSSCTVSTALPPAVVSAVHRHFARARLTGATTEVLTSSDRRGINGLWSRRIMARVGARTLRIVVATTAPAAPLAVNSLDDGNQVIDYAQHRFGRFTVQVEASAPSGEADALDAVQALSGEGRLLALA